VYINPLNYPGVSPLPWWERDRVRGKMYFTPTPPPSPVKGEGK